MCFSGRVKCQTVKLALFKRIRPRWNFSFQKILVSDLLANGMMYRHLAVIVPFHTPLNPTNHQGAFHTYPLFESLGNFFGPTTSATALRADFSTMRPNKINTCPPALAAMFVGQLGAFTLSPQPILSYFRGLLFSFGNGLFNRLPHLNQLIQTQLPQNHLSSPNFCGLNACFLGHDASPFGLIFQLV